MRYADQQIINEMIAHMRQVSGAFASWYVGISQDARSRLFSDHGVQQRGDRWIYRRALTSTTARNVEAYFINGLGTDGGPGGGDEYADYVYAYKKASHTLP